MYFFLYICSFNFSVFSKGKKSKVLRPSTFGGWTILPYFPNLCPNNLSSKCIFFKLKLHEDFRKSHFISSHITLMSSFLMLKSPPFQTRLSNLDIARHICRPSYWGSGGRIWIYPRSARSAWAMQGNHVSKQDKTKPQKTKQSKATKFFFTIII